MSLFALHAATSELDVTEAPGQHPLYYWIMLLECPQGIFVVQAAAAVLDGTDAADGSLKEDLSTTLCTPIGDGSVISTLGMLPHKAIWCAGGSR